MTLTLVQRIKTLRTALTDEDFIRNVRVEVNYDGSNEVLKEWNHPSITRPSDSELAAVTQADYDKIQKDWIWKRCEEYPIVVDQLDDIYHNGIDSWKAKIKAVKDKYPKN
tara:strand:+ start:483 stop:812 length:330 start_codon:yes stop_codon:yes gene_type:complete